MSRSSLNKVSYSRGVSVDLSDDEITMIEANPYSGTIDDVFDDDDSSSIIVDDDVGTRSNRRKRLVDATKRYVPSNRSFVRIGKILMILCAIVIVAYLVIHVTRSSSSEKQRGDVVPIDSEAEERVGAKDKTSDSGGRDRNDTDDDDRRVLDSSISNVSSDAKFPNIPKILDSHAIAAAKTTNSRVDQGGLLIKIPIPTYTDDDNDVINFDKTKVNKTNDKSTLQMSRNVSTVDTTSRKSKSRPFKVSIERKILRFEKISRDAKNPSLFVENESYIDLVHFVRDQDFLLNTLSCKNVRGTIASLRSSKDTATNATKKPSTTNAAVKPSTIGSSYFVPMDERNKQILKLTRRFWTRYATKTNGNALDETPATNATAKNKVVTAMDEESLINLARPLLINLIDRTELLEMQMFASIIVVVLESSYVNELRFILNNIDPIVIVTRMKALREEISALRSAIANSNAKIDEKFVNDVANNVTTTNSPIITTIADVKTKREIAAAIDDDNVAIETLIPSSIDAIAKCYYKTLDVGKNIPNTADSYYRATTQNTSKWMPVLPSMRYRGRTLARVATSNGTCYDLPKDEHVKFLKSFDSTAINNVSLGIGYVNHELTATFGTSVFLIDGTSISAFVPSGVDETRTIQLYRVPSFVRCLSVESPPKVDVGYKNFFVSDYRFETLLPYRKEMIATVTVYSSTIAKKDTVTIDKHGSINVSIEKDQKIATITRVERVDTLSDIIESKWMTIVPHHKFIDMDNVAFEIGAMKLLIKINSTNVEYATSDDFIV